jgi:SAM-dependent methyltransferase
VTAAKRLKQLIMPPQPFDELAAGYDATFTETAVGRALRAIVWSRLERLFPAPRRILELGCGTGEDALRLASAGHDVVAIDASPRMVQIARHKAESAGHAVRLQFHAARMEDVGSVVPGQCFDGVLSNFGAINCVPDLQLLARSVAARLSPGARLIWVVMGRHVPWEWGWYLSRGEWAKAWRRLERRGVPWRGLTIAYPTPAAVRRALDPCFTVDRIAPLGVVLPPTYAAAWLERSPRALRALTRLENLAHECAPVAFCSAFLSDHYIVEATRSASHSDVQT